MSSKQETNNNDRASSIMANFWEWRLVNAPEFATSVGMHKYDDRLDEISINSYLRMETEAKTLLKEVKDIQLEGQTLSDDVQLNLCLIASDLEQLIDGMQYKPYLGPLSVLFGPHRAFPRLLSLMKKENITDLNFILSRLRLFKQQVDEMISLLDEGIRLGFVPHKISIEKLPDVLRNVAELPVSESPIFAPFIEKPEGLCEFEWKDIVAKAQEIIETEVNPCYTKLSDFVCNKYLGHARPSISASSLPNGEAYYAACLRFHTTTNLTPKEIHEIGVSEVRRITRCMIDVKEQVNYEGTLKDFRAYVCSDEKFNFKDAAEILSHYKNIAKGTEEKLADYFHVLPKACYEVEPYSPLVAPSFPMASYEAPSDDGSRLGTFFVNTYKPEVRKKYDVLALCLHETVPGHHLQISLTMESGLCPDFRRFTGIKKYYQVPAYFAMNTGYLEGWGLYAEYLGEEMGVYSDPFDMFGRLSSEMLRACRLVVDTGMHAFEWSYEKAVEYMEENTLLDIHQIKSEIKRYISVPGQACSYKLGELKIKEVRKKAEEMLGNKFNLRLFHHIVASMGSVPLDILESQINIFIKQQLGT